MNISNALLKFGGIWSQLFYYCPESSGTIVKSVVKNKAKDNFEIMTEPDAPLDEGNWKLEAEGVINDVKAHVKDIHVSPKLCSNNKYIYLNVLILEDIKLCIELSGTGFRIVGNDFDDNSLPGDIFYETPYSVLDSVSPMYRNSFGSSLMAKLNDLKDKESSFEQDLD